MKGNIFSLLVTQRDAATLLPIVQKHRSEVQSDQWRVYNQVGSLPGTAAHSTVNHSLYFKDTVTGVHTEYI